mgnify:FL=1
MTRSLQMVSDALEIQNVICKYAIASDTQNFALLDDVFTPDASIDLAGMGPQSPESLKRTASQILETVDAIHHFVGLPALEVMGDRARSRCYFVAQHARNSLAPRPFYSIGGWWDDEFVRTGAGWRISKKIGTAVWCDGNPDVIGYPLPPGAMPRTEGRICPSWLTALKT